MRKYSVSIILFRLYKFLRLSLNLKIRFLQETQSSESHDVWFKVHQKFHRGFELEVELTVTTMVSIDTLVVTG